MSHNNRLTIAVAVFVTLLWSSSWVFIRLGLEGENLPPITFAGFRYTTAVLVLGSWIALRPHLRREVRSLDSQQWKALAVLGVVFYTLTQGAQFVAISQQPAATTSLLLSFTPLLVALMSQRALGETPSLYQTVGAALAAVGAVVYFFGSLGATAFGLIAAVVGLGANAGGAILGRSFNRDSTVSGIVVTAISMAIGSALMLAGGLLLEPAITITTRGAAIIGWLAVVNRAVAFSLWNYCHRRLSAVQTSGIQNTLLIQIATLAWIFLDEPPGLLGAVGIVIVSIGVLLTQQVN